MASSGNAGKGTQILPQQHTVRPVLSVDEDIVPPFPAFPEEAIKLMVKHWKVIKPLACALMNWITYQANECIH